VILTRAGKRQLAIIAHRLGQRPVATSAHGSAGVSATRDDAYRHGDRPPGGAGG
jgi:hypothetical protein